MSSVKSTQHNDNSSNPEGSPARDQERTAGAATVAQSAPDEPRRNPEENQRAYPRKVLREWLTILGLFAAAGAAIYQGVILSKQADTLNRQLEEMRKAAVQTNKLIQSNADLAAAAKAQAIAEANSAATAHDSLIMTERARIASVGATLQGIQIGQSVKGTVVYANLGREAVPVDMTSSINKWSKSDWKIGAAIPPLDGAKKKCMETTSIVGTTIVNPTYGLGSAYSNTVDSNDESLNQGDKFVGDNSMISGDTVITITACFVYKTVSALHHTASCAYYQAGTTPNFNQLNICKAGNGVD